MSLWAEVSEAALWVDTWAAGIQPSSLSHTPPSPQGTEPDHAHGGRWGSAPCLLRLPRNVVRQALGAPESGAVGTRPGGGRAPLSRWHLPW